MKLKYNFVVCNMGGKPVAVAVGKDNERFSGMVNLNTAGEVLFKLLNEGDLTQQELLSRFAAHFGVAEETAKTAVLGFVDSLRQGGLLDETV